MEQRSTMKSWLLEGTSMMGIKAFNKAQHPSTYRGEKAKGFYYIHFKMVWILKGLLSCLKKPSNHLKKLHICQ
jgi:hypothetical protein